MLKLLTFIRWLDMKMLVYKNLSGHKLKNSFYNLLMNDIYTSTLNFKSNIISLLSLDNFKRENQILRSSH